MKKVFFGDSIISRLERFREITESKTNFDEERARMILGELEDIISQAEISPGIEINPNISISDRISIREVLEFAIILNVRTHNYEEIRRYYEQLKKFYFYDKEIPQSQRMFMIIDLTLLVDLLLESSKFKKFKNSNNHYINSTKGNKNNEQASANNESINTDQVFDKDKDKSNEGNNNSDNYDKDDDEDQTLEGYYTVDFNDDYFHIDLAEIQIHFQNQPNLYFDYISKVDSCIRNSLIHSLFDIHKMSPSVLFDDILSQILEASQRNISINILSHSFQTNIIQIQKLLNFKKIEDTRQLLQSSLCRISEDGMVSPPDFLKKNKSKNKPSCNSFDNTFEICNRFCSLNT